MAANEHAIPRVERKRANERRAASWAFHFLRQCLASSGATEEAPQNPTISQTNQLGAMAKNLVVNSIRLSETLPWRLMGWMLTLAVPSGVAHAGRGAR